MKKRLGLLLLGITCLLIAIIWTNRDHLPPRRAVKVARIVSDLPVPRNAHVLEFQEQWGGATGDGGLKIVIQFSSAEYERAFAQSRMEGYLPIEHAEAGSAFVHDLVGHPVALGRVRLERRTDGSFELVVLDSATHRLYVFLSVQ